ncbi:DUF4111 domain-containing protein [Streptomyces sp. G44]|uniref:aminoglycoside adenylyltransferase family protein n=1 Tax=Streptomyces sp. G44 TaxID=2807632 RepID=UPI00195FAAA1|nr:aminoglycoside adenylyltransferase family protein [Streptomyces sp. G44]MBM7172778.1 DUF4111 domain-containing protein [Streptomyces sp. G44]
MAQIDDVVRLVRDVFGADDTIGVYLHGSAVLGGLRPHSDLDVFVLVRRRTTTARRRALTDGLLAISGSGADAGGGAGGEARRPVELTVAVQSDIRPWTYPPRGEYQYGEWLREAYVRGQTPAPGPSPDLALLATMVLRGRTPLVGPEPGRVLDPVPPGDVVRAMAAGLPELLDELGTDTRNVLLTLARIWTTLATGRIEPKDVAAEWVLGRLPGHHRPVLAHARAVHLGEECECWGALSAQVEPHAEYVVREIERLLPRG